MACPYFYPVKKLDSNAWVIPPRLPLGDPYTGECRATTPAARPDEDQLRTTCNVGYGRGRCECFPPDAESDAVRFHVEQDHGETIRILYVFESFCRPLRHGWFEYSVVARALTDAGGNALLDAQAVAFVESYLRRRA